MKNLIDITDEDVIKVIDKIHTLTENTVLERGGTNKLGYKESFKKFGSAWIEIELASIDRVTDGHWTSIGKCRIIFSHRSVWFGEYGCDGEPSNYNKNHLFGYLKLKELGYKIPNKPQM